MPIIIEHVKPNITPEENERRLKEIERTLSILLKRKITLTIKNDKK